MTTNPDLAAWAAGLLSDAELEARTGLSPQQAQYTDDARAVWFGDPMPAATSHTTACPHCYSTFVIVLPDDYRRCGDCQHRGHVSEFDRAGARVESGEALTYEDMTGYSVADIEAWAAEQMESEGGES
jgi:hypothetical protein